MIDEKLWDPWIEDMENNTSLITGAIGKIQTAQYADAIEDLKRSLHSIKGLVDSVGLEFTTETITEIESTIHNQDGDGIVNMTELLSQLEHKLSHLIITIAESTPSADQIKELDHNSGFETLLIKSAVRYKITIEIDEDMNKSMRAMALYNSIRNFAIIIESEPTQDELFDEVSFDIFSLIVETTENEDDLLEKVNNLRGVKNATIQQLDRDENKPKPDELSNFKVRVQFDQIKRLEQNFIHLSDLIEKIFSKNTSFQQYEEYTQIQHSLRVLQRNLVDLGKTTIDSITSRFPLMVKRLANKLDIKANILIQGKFIAIDRINANILIDPLTQIIRNSLSHGIEPPSERIDKGKSADGRIKFTARAGRNKLQIIIEDDGRGLDKDAILKKAEDLGIKLDPKAPDTEIYNLIFQEGFSTSTENIEVSGRGIGLHIAKERIHSVGGSILVEPGELDGTRFVIEIPDNDILVETIICNISQDKYAFPSEFVEEIVSHDVEINSENNDKIIYTFMDKNIPLFDLRNLLGGDRKAMDMGLKVIICRVLNKVIGFIVDDIETQIYTNIKPLSSFINRFNQFYGSIFGSDQEIIFVIDPRTYVEE